MNKPQMMTSTHPNPQPTQMDKENVVVAQVLADLHRFRVALGNSHVKTGEAWNSLGLIRMHMQQDAMEAKPCLEEALRIFKKNDERALEATTLNDLGNCLERLNQHEKAFDAYKEAREIFETEKFSESHPRVLSTQRSLSRLCRE